MTEQLCEVCGREELNCSTKPEIWRCLQLAYATTTQTSVEILSVLTANQVPVEGSALNFCRETKFCSVKYSFSFQWK